MLVHLKIARLPFVVLVQWAWRTCDAVPQLRLIFRTPDRRSVLVEALLPPPLAPPRAEQWPEDHPWSVLSPDPSRSDHLIISSLLILLHLSSLHFSFDSPAIPLPFLFPPSSSSPQVCSSFLLVKNGDVLCQCCLSSAKFCRKSTLIDARSKRERKMGSTCMCPTVGELAAPQQHSDA